jgi:hypothetical protein
MLKMVVSKIFDLTDNRTKQYLTRRQIFSHKYVFGGSFGMSLEGDCNAVEVTSNLELLLTFGMSLKGICHEFYT